MGTRYSRLDCNKRASTKTTITATTTATVTAKTTATGAILMEGDRVVFRRKVREVLQVGIFSSPLGLKSTCSVSFAPKYNHIPVTTSLKHSFRSKRVNPFLIYIRVFPEPHLGWYAQRNVKLVSA